MCKKAEPIVKLSNFYNLGFEEWYDIKNWRCGRHGIEAIFKPGHQK